jgi:hypothetical protein
LETERNYLKPEVEKLTSILHEAPDPVELAEVRAHFTVQKLLEEKDKRIEGLKREVGTLNVFTHYLR